MRRQLFTILTLLSLLASCSPTSLASNVSNPTSLPPTIPSLTQAAPATSLPTVLIPTDTPTSAPSPTPTPQSLADWALANQPDPTLIKLALDAYARSIGIPVDSIQTEAQLRTGVNGQFAVFVDKAAGVPFFIAKSDPAGRYAWKPATLDNVAQERGMRFGALLNLNRDFHDITLKNFGTGNAYIDWNLVEPQKGVWDFSDPDYGITTAFENGTPVMANLIWGRTSPIGRARILTCAR
jgi:hypothetical protein